MELSYTDDQNRFREEVRTWISEAMPPVIKKKAEDGANFENSETMEWHKILFKKGWVAPNWPEEIGGPGWDVAERSIFQEECVRAGTPGLSPFGLSMVGPLLIQYGSPEQKERFLPQILAGEEIWCQGYSEPNAGSDLASLQLRADSDGADYILKAYIAATAAGWGRILPVAVAALIIALFETIGAAIFSHAVAEGALYAGFVLLLAFRPQGLAGEATGRRA